MGNKSGRSNSSMNTAAGASGSQKAAGAGAGAGASASQRTAASPSASGSTKSAGAGAGAGAGAAPAAVPSPSTAARSLTKVSEAYIPPKDEAAFKARYQLKGVLGNGNYSVVRKAVDLTSGEQVAVKCVDKRKLTKEDEEALKIEVAILVSLQHPTIIRLFDWYQETKMYFVVTEFMAGGELFDRIVKREFYSEADAQRVVGTLADCLKYLHDRGVAHRDLKPENILLKDPKDDASIKIADFGFARVVPAKGLSTACGTPGYVAPEIINGKPYGVSVDVWSLGVVTYILLSGYPPFYNTNQNQLFKMIREGKFVFDSPYWDPVSPEAKTFIKGMLTVDVNKRLTMDGVLADPWLRGTVSTKDITPALAELKKFNARRKLRAGIRAALAANRLADLIKGADLGEMKEQGTFIAESLRGKA